MNVKQILKNKTNTIYSISPDFTVFEALKEMNDKNIGSLLVMESNNLLGIISERDYARKIILKDKASKETLVKDIMEIDFPKITPEDKLEICMELMSSNKIRYLPVFEQDNLIGIVSMSDVVKFMIENQKNIIENLQNYISQ